MEIVNKLYNKALEDYLKDSFFDETLVAIPNIKWEKEVIVEYAPQIEEVVQMLNDFNDRKYNRANREEISLAAAFILYFINMSNSEMADDFYKDITTQKLFTSTMLKTLSSTLANYREYKLVNDLFLKKPIKTNYVNTSEKINNKKPVNEDSLSFHLSPEEIGTTNKQDKDISSWGFGDLDFPWGN